MYSENGKEITWETFGFGTKIDKSKIVTILGEPSFRSKPKRAWWGSRTDTEYGWKHWCEDNCYRTCEESNKSVWGLEVGSKILKVSRDDLEILNYIVEGDISISPIKYQPIDVEKHIKAINNRIYDESHFSSYAIDFNKIKDDGYDAVELMDANIGHGIYDMRSVLTCFNCWDCESIVILNPEKIIFL